jgi:hypothetical protein
MWAWIFGGIAVAGIVMLVMYAIWLWHKASDLMSEVEWLGSQAEEIATLLGQIEFDRLDRPAADRG